MSLLDSVEDFRGLYGLSEEELGALCAELRERILDVTLKNGGHLSSSLGAVELTVALLRVFNPDSDKIIFDVGHQSYAYKLLTKRLGRFPTLRRKGGISGFPRMDESPYDFFTTGHSSTSISAAMGYAKARDLKRESYEVVAVIGDGALLNGVSFEALNAMASVKSKVIIVLNDNKMSINPRVGGMASHLAKLAVNPTYKKFKDYVKYQCAGRRNGESVHQALSQIKQKLKSLLLPTNIFEELNISYWGPFNGHNVTEMEEVFRLARHYDEPLLIHVLTQKGKGCKAAEENPAFFHGVGPMTKIDAPAEKAGGEESWSGVMARALCAAAVRHDAAVSVYHYLSSRNAAVARRPAYDETPRRVYEVFRFVVRIFPYRLVHDVFFEVAHQPFACDALVMLRGKHYVIHSERLVTVVFHRHLCFSVRAQVWQQTRFSHLGKARA